MRRRFLWTFVVSMLVLALSGCAVLDTFTGGKDGDEDSADPAVDTTPMGETQSLVGVPEEDLDFGLEPESTPTFGEVEQPEQATDEDDVLYTEQDGYLYRLDPATLEPVGEPLDPETKQPVDQTAVEEKPVEQAQPEETNSQSQEEPTEENSYPNTGIFLEDD